MLLSPAKREGLMFPRRRAPPEGVTGFVCRKVWTSICLPGHGKSVELRSVWEEPPIEVMGRLLGRAPGFFATTCKVNDGQIGEKEERSEKVRLKSFSNSIIMKRKLGGSKRVARSRAEKVRATKSMLCRKKLAFTQEQGTIGVRLCHLEGS